MSQPLDSRVKSESYAGEALTDFMHIHADTSKTIKLCVDPVEDHHHTVLYGAFQQVTGYFVSFTPLDAAKAPELQAQVEAALKRISKKSEIKYPMDIYRSHGEIKVIGGILSEEAKTLRAEIHEKMPAVESVFLLGELIFIPTGDTQLSILEEEVLQGVVRVRENDFKHGRFESRTPTYVYEQEGDIKIGGALTFEETKTLYSELGPAILPSLETAQELDRAGRNETRGSLTGVYDEPIFNEWLHPYERAGNWSKTSNAKLFDDTIELLRKLYATGELTARELRDQSLLLALRVLSAQVKDPTEEFLPLNRLLEERAKKQGNDAVQALAIRVEPDAALFHPEIRQAFPEFLRDTTDGIMRVITGGRMGTDILGDKKEVEQWRRELGTKLAKDYEAQWGQEREDSSRAARLWFESGQFRIDMAKAETSDKESEENEDDINRMLPVVATRQLAKILPPPMFLERNYSGNVATEGQLGPIERPRNESGWQSRLPNSVIVPRQRLPEELERLLARSEAVQSEYPSQLLLPGTQPT